MNNSNEHKKKEEHFSNSNFTFTSGGENKPSIKDIQNSYQSLFDQDHPKQLESLSKYLMLKFLTVIVINLFFNHYRLIFKFKPFY